MKKLVNGRVVDLTPEEIAARQAEEAENDVRNQQEQTQAEARKADIASLKALKKSDLKDAATIADALLKLVKHLNL